MLRGWFSCTNEWVQAPLTLGAVDTEGYTGSLYYTAAQKTLGEYYGYYLVYVEDFEVDGESLDADMSSFNLYGGMLVDSGTTELILPTGVYVAFAEYLLKTIDWLDEGFFEVLYAEALLF